MLLNLIAELAEATHLYAERLSALPETSFTRRPAPDKWSPKEIIGHLVDSAQNNIQRFVRAQYEEQPVHILYRQNDWVALQHYQAYPAADLLSLWVLLNRHLAHIWRHMPPEAWAIPCRIGPSATETISLEDLAADYLRHLQHHLAQIGLEG
ncbi:MAG: DinB family protein [Saprospiraceae bacterium]|nr:DinB family protein [Saprospiraceae bacterium]